MNETTVTSKGQVTIPKAVRQRLGSRTGTKVGFAVVRDQLELRLLSQPPMASDSGFGMLKSSCASVPADFAVATLLQGDRDAP